MIHVYSMKVNGHDVKVTIESDKEPTENDLKSIFEHIKKIEGK